MKLGLAVSSLVAIGLLALAGCVSTVLPRSSQRSDAGITSAIQASLGASEKVKVTQLEIETLDRVVHLTGLVDTEAARREAGRVVWSTEGVGSVVNGLTVAESAKQEKR